ncbi:hypothetical protein GCM10010407_05610 [Rarobacter incanus]
MREMEGGDRVESVCGAVTSDIDAVASDLNSALDRDASTEVADIVGRTFWQLLDHDPALAIRGLYALDPAVTNLHPGLRAAKSLCGLMDTRYVLAPAGDAPGRDLDRTDLVAMFQDMMFGAAHRKDSESLAAARAVRELALSVMAGDTEHAQAFFGMVLLHTGIISLLNEDFDAAITDFNAAHRLGRNDGALLLERDAHAKLGLVHGLLGRVNALDAGARPGQPDPTAVILRPYTHYSHDTVGALRAVERLDPDARERAYAIDVLDPLNSLWPIALLLRCRMELVRGTPGKVLDQIALVSGVHDRRKCPLSRDIVMSVAIDAFSAIGEYGMAWDVYAKHPAGIFTGTSHLRLLLATGEYDRAQQIIDANLNCVETYAVVRDESIMALAWLRVATGQPIGAATARHIVRLVTQESKWRVAWAVPPAVHQALCDESPEFAAAFAAHRQGNIDADSALKVPLSNAELRVLRAIAVKDTVARAGQHLYLSPNTVKTHLASIYRKLGVHDRQGMLARAGELGLL